MMGALQSWRCGCLMVAGLFAGMALTVAQPAEAQQPSGGKDDVASVYADFLHFARLGKFDEAKAMADKLLAHSDLTPLALLAASDRDKESVPTLLMLIKHTTLSETSQKILDVIREGEFEKRKETSRIRENIDKLGGPPQMEFAAIQRLKESGEYAIPEMIDALHDGSKAKLAPRIVRALPQIGQSAVGPLVYALGIEDREIRKHVIWALGEIGYPQAVPYLLQIARDEDQSNELREAALSSIGRIVRTSDRAAPTSTVSAFLALANQYYDEHGSVRADPRVPKANVWYLRDDRLTAVEVPREIFGPVMAMRCCEEALLDAPADADAMALWLAGNIRREARLGMDVESTEPDASADADATRDPGFPRSVYFARAAGPEHCHLVLGRAVADTDKHAALGAIAALEAVAGESSLVGSESHKQALVEALRFPDAEVRFKAAIALARALPRTPFRGADLVGHVLSEAVRQTGEPQYVLATGDSTELNRMADELRASGARVVAETNFHAAMERARRELQHVNGFILGTDLESPPVATATGELQREYRFTAMPVVLMVYPDQSHRAEMAVLSHQLVAEADRTATADEVLSLMGKLLEDVKGGPMSPELASELALRATEALRLAALDGRTVIDISPAIDSLIQVLGSSNEDLRLAATRALALMPTSIAQTGVASVALDSGNAEPLRLAAFEALAESARRYGNLLGADHVSQVVKTAADTSNLTLSTSASQALGALNLTSNQVSEIVRGYHRG